MSIKSKMLGAATTQTRLAQTRVTLALVTLTLVAGAAAGALPAGPAGAATASCGPRCVDVFSPGAGTYRHPNLVFDVLRQAQKVGQPIVAFPASRKDPGEDFTISFQSRVSDFYRAGLVTTWLAQRYGGLGCQKYRPGTSTCLKRYPDDHAYEIEYAPLGVHSGLCVGVPVTAGDGTLVSLQPCGVSARTVWVADVPNSTGRSLFHYYAPLINGSQTRAPHVFVLTYPGRSRQLVTRPLAQCGCRHPVGNSQQWGADSGVLK